MNAPFAAFRTIAPERSALRQAITDHTRAPEPERVAALSIDATLTPAQEAASRATARKLVEALRRNGTPGLVQGLIREYDLSSQEGVALMCLAEALLRIPDTATRDALIRDKIAKGHWQGHIRKGTPLFVNAATWGLIVSGGFLSTTQAKRLPQTLDTLLKRCGEPVIRRGVDMAMRLMGEQFVTGQTIDEALKNGRKLEEKGYRYSYDMLGEAAMTAEDAERYYRDYERAIHAIGKASNRMGVYRGPGISIKLSALHPRYARLQRERVLTELLPRVTQLARLACAYDIGFNIDAEEADRLELSLDLLEALCFDETLRGWKGIGFVVQAYQKRAPFVLDWVIDLARRSGHRLMVRLVKGAYWDSEIKRAQTDGQSDFPVYTRKLHTDIAYIACAKKLLDAPDAIFPQFATHNAQTLASIHAYAGPGFSVERYEFQCLHGMGEGLYDEVVGPRKLDRPVRIYAPVGTHETLLAYLVRRLLENGANSSFINRIQDGSISVEELSTDPVTLSKATPPGYVVPLPHALYGTERVNSQGLDLSDENTLRRLARVFLDAGSRPASIRETPAEKRRDAEMPIRNPANRDDLVGHIAFLDGSGIGNAIQRAEAAFPHWRDIPAAQRAAHLEKTADLLEAEMPSLMALIMREAGKTLANAVAEIREAVDFLRYYAAQARGPLQTATPLGPVACISPWNFPLAIFLGQVSAALAVGNTVLAKPAEETPLIAREAIRLLHESGIAQDVVQLIPGEGAAGAQLVNDPRITAVLFTGSTDVARLIQKQLAGRLNRDLTPVPLIAETGGQNALIVDSSALTEQVVTDVLASAFDSAGQRCSALRLLCVQEESADRLITMLEGAMRELRTGTPERPDTDVGPVISAEARAMIAEHIETLRQRGHRVYQTSLAPEAGTGTFIPPTLIEIDAVSDLRKEVFGPVLHVLRYRREDVAKVMEAINATGYALTFGIHSRIDDTIETLKRQSHAGNIYINRNLVGAVVGVQPFGGHGLSGTGPKAGGPLYLRRLLARRPALPADYAAPLPDDARLFADWMATCLPETARAVPDTTLLGLSLSLAGPVGESNLYSLAPRGTILCAGPTQGDLCTQILAALATGNRCAVPAALSDMLPALPPGLGSLILRAETVETLDLALANGDEAFRRTLGAELAARSGQIVSLHTPDTKGDYPLEWLVLEYACSTNTTAAGGNAALMARV
ncbi:bifunctional proline dehydrogenase/L-glutamate gamma-semialdehyde dehydrogenase PutA [Swaminathania salitolerans]|uniref:Bifunctional protein PutA n=1 Tax=Swaminathania salitolerans TaxID=182838 RepID=A0A511BKE1_9PROT|nr:bifunctional proline dehydrogenase/L-glutamate gamma-semialdehyde dehydrogenase PutA [Swaminathania salitolerans]GBQ09815.1 bifunctional proline dehydrogenase/pyrroline-5-carboxylate dehydrogenase [Swaminathania salitolerans LMG 21291]GEL00839.1 bifunctional protein PutA [Swaminathania salitolerans]